MQMREILISATADYKTQLTEENLSKFEVYYKLLKEWKAQERQERHESFKEPIKTTEEPRTNILEEIKTDSFEELKEFEKYCSE